MSGPHWVETLEQPTEVLLERMLAISSGSPPVLLTLNMLVKVSGHV
eukprot:CAMPEP_0206312752 /NCGR_PEP_ID=MMETSP0106_2-20121207/14157_1 /ASSEMBLY_ACC=CAM_ASM_000206 /TAXON_ID=81532 /ORGANISM="Acanthoeca-like sp., Strain 10tr" /LENGTH=45 /DNA_ID= /DNA_START= /DNA_END= /DNA_ORIENTATION=